MATRLGNNRFEGDFGMPMLPGAPLSYERGDYVRITALELCAREITRNNVPGAAAELGVYKGSFARHINRLFPGRELYLFDTFEGFSLLDIDAGRAVGLSEAGHDWSDTSMEAVVASLPHPELARVRRGRFPETAVDLPDTFCFVSLDADLYAPTLEGLRVFWPLLAPGGYIMVHDYNNAEYPGAGRAVREFREAEGVPFVCLPDICGSVILAK